MKKHLTFLLAAVMLLTTFLSLPGVADAAPMVTPGTTCLHEHAYVDPAQLASEPTCTQPGSAYYYCPDCGRELPETGEIPALGHDWGEWSTIKDATCNSEGSRSHTCARCGVTETETIPVSGHDWTEWKADKEATCTEPGTEKRSCRHCNASETRNVEALGHEFGDWYVSEIPRYKTPLKLRRDCVRNDTFEEKEIPMSLKIEQVDQSGPESVFVGSIIDVTYRVTNTSEIEASVSSYGDNYAKDRFAWLDSIKGGWPDDFTCLQPGESSEFTISHYVMDDDFSRGKLIREVSVAGSAYVPYEGGGTITDGYVYSDIIEVEIGIENPDPVGEFTIELVDQSDLQDSKEGSVVLGTYNVTNVSKSSVIITSFGDDDDDHVLASGDSLNGEWPDEFSWLEPGKSAKFQLAHVVTKDDLARGKLIRHVRVGGEALKEVKENTFKSYGGTVFSNDADLTVDLGEPVETEPLNGKGASIYLIKQLATPIPESGFFVPDDNVCYSITVCNMTDAKLENVELTDHLSDGKDSVLSPVSVEPNSCTILYFIETVTANHAGQGYMEDYVTASIGGQEYSSNAVSVNVDYGEPALVMTKTELSTPQNGAYASGETIDYEIKIFNPSDKTYHDGKLFDSLIEENDGLLVENIGLGPNETYTAMYSYEVTDKDSGFVYNDATLMIFATDDNPIYAFAECMSPVAPAEPTVTVEKNVIGGPDNGLFYIEGEQVTYELSVTNTLPDKSITDVELYDSRDTSQCVAAIAQLAPGESLKTTFIYTVTGKDAKDGYVDNFAFAFYSIGEDKYLLESGMVTVGTGIPEPGLTIIKAITSSPKEGSYYKPGEQVDFLLTVVNNSMYDCTDLNISDTLSGLDPIAPIATLGAGDSVSVSVSCDLQKLPVNNTYSNAAVLNYKGPGGYFGMGISNMVSFDYFEAKPQLEVYKEETSTPDNGWFYVGNEPVDYKITVTNTGESAITGGDVLDILAPGGGSIGTLGPLKPTESQTFTMTYTDGDHGMGYVQNQASVIVEDAQKVEYTFYSNVVTTNYGTITKDEDVIKLSDSEDMCRLSMIAGPDDDLAYSVTNCTEHTPIDVKIRTAAENAEDTAALQKAYEDGIILWSDAIDKIYDAMNSQTYGAGSRTAILNDRLLFQNQVEKKRELLDAQYPDDPDVVAELICNMYREKCTDLCWLYHSERGAISDSSSDDVLSVLFNACHMDLDTESNGYLLYCLDFCEEHLHTTTNTSAAIKATLAHGSRPSAKAWAELRGIWTTLLDEATVKHYDAADESLKPLLETDRAVFNSSMMLYEELLLHIDPDQSYADEAITRALLLRTIQLCGCTDELVYISKANAKVVAADGTEGSEATSKLTLNPLFGAGASREAVTLGETGGGINLRLIIGICAAVVVIGAVLAIVLVRRRKRY